MKLVTLGNKYLDIDAYACAVAYAELLNLQGDDAIAYSAAPLNASINDTIRSWNVPLVTSYSLTDKDSFVIVDASEPDILEEAVDLDKVVEVIDHHLGFEDYWQQRIGNKAHIEFIGAACTLIYERWKQSGRIDQMSRLSARLLVCGILDNTLNFGASVTTDRDIEAYKQLLPVADLSPNWPEQYFSECQEGIFQDIATAIKNDTKTMDFRSFAKPIGFGQMAVWDGQEILHKHFNQLIATMSTTGPTWLINLISLEEGKSHFITENTDLQSWLEELLDIKFDGSVATAPRLWLRKEVVKQDLDNH